MCPKRPTKLPDMRFSKYNVVCKCYDGVVIYNTNTSAIIKLDHAIYEELKKLDHISENGSSKEEENLFRYKIIADDKKIVKDLIRLREKQRESKELIYFIYPTLGCNFKCQYCFQKDLLPTDTMSDNTAKNLIDYITSNAAQLNSDRIDITWMGGEPLLEFDTIEYISRFLSENLKKIVINSKLITNGSLISASILKRIDKINISSIQVTLDGTELFHNAKRKTNDGEPTFNTIIRKVDQIVKKFKNIHVAFRVNLDIANYEVFPQLYEFLILRYANCNYSIAPSFVDNFSLTCKSGNEGESILDRKRRSKFYIDLYKKHNIKVIDFLPSVTLYSCIARSKHSCAIGPDGGIYKCTAIVGDKSLAIGNINNEKNKNLRNLDNHPFISDTDYLNNDKCITCQLFPVCNGGCDLIRTKNINKTRKIDTCHLAKGFEKEFIKIYLKEMNSTVYSSIQ